MDRISTATKAANLFGVGKHGFKDGDLGAGVEPTDLNAEFFNGLQEEALAIIESAGIVPDAAVRTQVRQAIDIMIRKAAGMVAVAGGTADALTGDFTPDVAAYTDGMTFRVRAAAANNSTAPTFKPDALAAKTIVKGNNVALVVGDIAGAGHWLALQYDQTLDKFVLLNPASGVVALGFGQTVQNLAGSRALSTTYTNTTGRPIFLHVRVISSTTAATSVALTVNGVNAGSSTTVTTTGAGTQCCTVVPPGGSYLAAVSGGATLSEWIEIR